MIILKQITYSNHKMKSIINSLAIVILLVPSFQFIGGNYSNSLKLHFQHNDPTMDRSQNSLAENNLLSSEDVNKLYQYIIMTCIYTSLYLVVGTKALFILAKYDFI